MAKFTDYVVNTEVRDIMEKILKSFPNDYIGFDLDGVHTVMTKSKKSKKPYRLKATRYPEDTLHDKVYMLEIFEEVWGQFTQTKKDHLVNRIMMSIPEGGFASDSDTFAKIKKPDFEFFQKEHKLTGGKLNWIEDGSDLPDLYAQGSVLVS